MIEYKCTEFDVLRDIEEIGVEIKDYRVKQFEISLKEDLFLNVRIARGANISELIYLDELCTPRYIHWPKDIIVYVNKLQPHLTEDNEDGASNVWPLDKDKSVYTVFFDDMLHIIKRMNADT